MYALLNDMPAITTVLHGCNAAQMILFLNTIQNKINNYGIKYSGR